MNERSIGNKSRYTNFHNIDNSARGDKTKLVTEKMGNILLLLKKKKYLSSLGLGLNNS